MDRGIDTPLKVIAFYLPQFHPVPENDNWWGKGFTEWANVTKAKPLYKKHLQPKLPGELGYYDLRVRETRQAQADLARQYGLTAFCYWHYWFGNGKRILERPFNEVVSSGEPDFPFCLAWANQTWTGIWHGEKNKILAQQEYHGLKDYENHFYSVLPAFQDSRYFRIHGKPLFLVYNPWDIPDTKAFVDKWQELALKEGLPGVYFIGMDKHDNILSYGMQGSTWHEPTSHRLIKENSLKRIARKVGLFNSPLRYNYADLVKAVLNKPLPNNRFPMVMPGWDNTPRSGKRGLIYEASTPELFGQYMKKAIQLVQSRDKEEQIVFIKAWNEWAEGNYLEPDQVNGVKYLEQLKACVL